MAKAVARDARRRDNNSGFQIDLDELDRSVREAEI
jgi:hypothetical protein